MEFRVGGNLGSDALKKKLPIRVINSNLSGLREIVQQMKTIQKNAFKKRHGNLLRLLNAEVQASAVTALAQYYDPPLKCFTFQDFQLVPTIEEFEQILGLSMEDKVPYRHSEQHASVSTLAGILKVHLAELEGKMASKGNSKGIPQGYLEGHLHLLAEKEMRETFMDVLALTLYGVILFPNMENFVDQTALDMFVAYKIHSESPVTAVLADVYGSLNLCHTLKRKKMLCCVPMLYVWFISRIRLGTLNVECLIGELPPSGIEIRGAKEWAQFCASLNGGRIRWCVPGLSKSRVISCGAFPNVPLIGTRSCVNYNPVLAQRQFGCPIKSSPTPESLVAVWNYYEEGISLDLIRRIRSAWGEVLRVVKDPRPWVIDEKMSYRRWILERVNTVKLPFKSDSPAPEWSEPAESEEMKRLKEEMEKMKLKNAKLINELQSLRHEYVDMRRDKEEMTKAYEGILRKQREERDHAFRVKQDLAAANTALKSRDRERDAAATSMRQRDQMCEEFKREKTEALKRLHNAQVRISEVERQMREMVSTYEVKMDEERWHRAELEKEHQEVISRMNEYSVEQEMAMEHWRRCFSQLASLANGAIEGIPRLLAEAEAALPIFNPPREIEAFFSHCKELIREMKNMIARARE